MTYSTTAFYGPFPQRIKAARLAAGLTQEALAEAAGVSIKTFRRWEQGKSNPTCYDNVYRLGQVLCINTVDFFPPLDVWHADCCPVPTP